MDRETLTIMGRVMVPVTSITTYLIPNIDRQSVAATRYKLLPVLLAIVSAGAFSLTARADATIAYDPQDPHSVPFLHAAAGVSSNYQSQVISDLSENPFNHTLNAAGVDQSGLGQTACSLDLSFTDSSITSAGSSSGHYSNSGKGSHSAFADSQENFILYITVTDQPVSFTLDASTSASGVSSSLISLSGTDVSVQYDTFTGVWPQSGTTTGILNPGTYVFRQADSTPLPNAPFGSGDSSSSAQLEFSAIAVPNLPGDFNNDGVVDAADYVVWRQGLDTTYTQDDYDVWRANFGQTTATASGANVNSAVPEPATVILLMFAAANWFLRRGRNA
jgi:hypothetical protein